MASGPARLEALDPIALRARSFLQVASLFGVFIDGEGRTLEVIMIDRGHGPKPVVRATWRGCLLGNGYYGRLEDALALVDVDTLVELVNLPTAQRP